jgi:excinuclease ABC subunit B
MNKFKIHADYKPAGSQPEAIDKLSQGILEGKQHQVLLGVTGSGKTFTMANIIERVQRPALILSHNKTLAAQLCAEFRDFFPENAVEYFVSYYDYYQPEAYVPSSDLYIEKVSSINDEIDKLRHSATSALNERRDVIVVASVSCIYSIGDPEKYLNLSISLRPGMKLERDALLKRLVGINYQRNDVAFERGDFRVKGDTVEIYPANSTERAIRAEFFGSEIDRLTEIDVLTGRPVAARTHAAIFPATHYAMERESMKEFIGQVERDMEFQVEAFRQQGKLLEAERLSQRTKYDLEMMRELGYCTGIENYSRYFDGRKPGQPPFTLLDYFPKDFILFIDESHVSLPQVRGMYHGDRSRKDMLVSYGFRLSSAYDNRPLKFDEFTERINQAVYVSATPAEYEIKKADGEVVEQIVRPTGLLDPVVLVRPVDGQVEDLLAEIRSVVEKGFRVLVTTLTKKLAERLTDFYAEMGIRVRYLHSDIDTLERMEIIRGLRLGEFDALVGINLLREGLDLPEVALVAVLDADKEGFLRNATSLIQTIGRAARNEEGRVILYADKMTGSMAYALSETERRRKLQAEYNEQHGIKPKSVVKSIRDLLEVTKSISQKEARDAIPENVEQKMRILEEQMKKAAIELEFEAAAKLRDELYRLQALVKNHQQ